jgi:hypothetical protein
MPSCDSEGSLSLRSEARYEAIGLRQSRRRPFPRNVQGHAALFISKADFRSFTTRHS